MNGIARRALPRANWQDDRSLTLAVPETTAARFRITFELGRRMTLSQLRLSSAADAPMSWVTGLYALRLTEDNAEDDDGRYLEDASTYSLDSHYQATSLAAYGEATLALAAGWSLGGGLRLEQRDAHYHDTDGQGFDPRDRMWGGQVTLAREMDDGAHAYLVVSRGYKAGGFNSFLSGPVEELGFGPESVDYLEAGAKLTFADGAARIDIAVFDGDYADLQVAVLLDRAESARDHVAFEEVAHLSLGGRLASAALVPFALALPLAAERPAAVRRGFAAVNLFALAVMVLVAADALS